MAKTILIADDDQTLINLFHLNMESRDLDIHIHSSDSGEGTIATLTEQKPDLIVLDIRMPRGDGFSVLEHMQEQNMDIPVLILTNYRNEQYIAKSKTYSNVRDYIVKHEVRMDSVMNAVHSILS